MNPIIKVLLAEDHTMVREGLRAMLDLELDIEVVGEATNGREAVAIAMEMRPDVVLMDIAMPEMNGLEATRSLLKKLPGTKVVILTAHCDDAYIKSATDSGAVGLMLKQDTAHDVCTAVRAVFMGSNYCSSTIARRLDRLNSKSREQMGKYRKNPPPLTPREMEVLQLVAEGEPNKGIALVLGISIKTVEKHRGHLMAKLDIHDTANLTRYAVAVGIIESSVQLTIL